jgi:hypothetical protein
MYLLSKAIMSIVFTLFTLIAYSDTIIDYDSFKSGCLEDFGGKEFKIKNTEEYRAYNNKLCECLADQFKEMAPEKKVVTIDEVTQFKEVIGGCLAQTYMISIMDRVKEDKPLTADKILAACVKENKVIYPEQTSKYKEISKTLCTCSANKIMTLNEEQQTDPNTLKTVYIECAKQLQQQQ